ncbi:MAG: flippase-like domain-containing protein [gamma proteobacterium symbiont of Taylorina sp.]|nr:flippase-like domain-containing protein [gamma proteobacterium symbiont of Taylorina sp.]
MINQRHHFIVLFFGLTITCAALWYALRDVDINKVLNIFTEVNWVWGGVLICLYALHFWLKATRWALLLSQKEKIKPQQVLAPLMLGFFANNILPARLGEFVRMYLASRTLELKKMQVLTTIILERIFDILTIVFLLAITLVLESHIDETLILAGYIMGGIGCFILIIMICYAHYTNLFLKYLLMLIPSPWHESILYHMNVIADGLHTIKSLNMIFYLAINSLIQWLLMAATIYISLHAVGIDVPVSASIFVLAAVVFAITLPAAPGFFGIIQLAFVLALAPFSITETLAFSASIFFHLITYLSVMLSGFYFMQRFGYDFKIFKQATEE